MQVVSQSNRCGIDLVDIEKFTTFYSRTDETQLLDIFTHDELTYSRDKHDFIQSLAGCFAAKEACMKLFPSETALKELDFIDIELGHDYYGAPIIKFTDKLKELMQKYQYQQISISLSHTETNACAVVFVQ